MTNNTIYFGDGPLNVGEALEIITEEKILDGEACSQTLIDALNIIRDLINDKKQDS